jgi:uncharacterized membrane protein
MKEERYGEKAAMRIKTTGLLLTANSVLVLVGWIAAIIAYPSLPEKVPLWYSLFRDSVVYQEKSPLFFICVAAQTVFCALFLLASRFVLRTYEKKQKGNLRKTQKERALTVLLGKEMALLASIFFNLIFIHIQTSLIFLSHNSEKGFSPYYFVKLFAVILMLIPYYLLRIKIASKEQKST